MNLLKTSLIALVCAGLFACSNPDDMETEMPEMPDWQSITGTVSYRERIMLRPSATLNVVLQDVSKADAPAVLIAEQTIENPGNVPIQFDLKYNPAIIQDSNTYVVRATIYDGSDAQFVTDTAYNVLTRGASNSVDLILVSSNKSKAGAGVDVMDVNWQLTGINGRAAEAGAGNQPLSILFDSENDTVSGFAGCNRFTGGLTYKEGLPEIGDVAMTMMACADTMALEQEFVAALNASEAYKIIDGQLRTYGADGTELLIFDQGN